MGTYTGKYSVYNNQTSRSFPLVYPTWVSRVEFGTLVPGVWGSDDCPSFFDLAYFLLSCKVDNPFALRGHIVLYYRIQPS